jgi:hypothetical protein
MMLLHHIDEQTCAVVTVILPDSAVFDYCLPSAVQSWSGILPLAANLVCGTRVVLMSQLRSGRFTGIIMGSDIDDRVVNDDYIFGVGN